MKVKKKILIAFCLAILLFLAFAGGTILYYYTHPHAIKLLVERAVSRSTGMSFTIKTLSYSLKPLNFRAKGIIFKPSENQPGPYLEISDLDADMTLEGPLGQKTLTVKSFKIHEFSLQLDEKVALPKIAPKQERPSFFTKIYTGAIPLFLFRDISLEAAEVTHGHVAAKFADQTIQISEIHAILNPDQRIAISSSMQIKGPSQNLLFTAPNVRVTTDSAISLVNPEISAVVEASDAMFSSPQGDVKKMGVTSKISYSHKHKRLDFETMDLQLEGVDLKQGPEIELPPLNLGLKTKGALNTQDRKLNITSLDLNVHDTIYLQGILDMEFGDQADFKFQVLDCHFLSQALMTLLPDSVKRSLAPATVSGPIHLQGDLRGQRDPQKWGFHCDLQSSLKHIEFSYTKGQIQLSSKISGNIHAVGTLPDINISGSLAADETVLSAAGIQPEPFKGELHVSGKYPVYLIEDLSVHIPRANMELARKDILIQDIRMQAHKGKIDAREKALSLPEIRLDSSWLKNLRISVEFGRGQLALKLQGKDINLIESARGLQLLPSGWQFGGDDSFQINALQNEQGKWTFTSELALQNLAFQSQDANYIGEKISLHMKTDGSLNLRDSQVAAKTTLAAEVGELLLDRYYLDLSTNGLFSSFEGKYDISQKFLETSSFGFGLKDILAVAGNGTLHLKAPNPLVQLSINIPKTALQPIFHHFVLEPFKTEKPFLSTLDIGGHISADLTFASTPSERMVKGRWKWHEGQLSSGDGRLSLSGIDLDLPLWYQIVITPGLPSPVEEEGLGGDGEETALKGEFSIQSLALPLLPEQSIRFPLDATPNRISIKSPTVLKVPGGRIEFGPVACKEVFSAEPSIETSLTLEGIEVDPLLSEIWSRSTGGTIEGKLDSIRFEKHAVHSDGELKASVFGGEIYVSGLGASGVLTSTPLFRLNARWNDLRLGDLTRETSFGKIDGVMKGHVNDLEIAYGQPQGFDLMLETVKKKGVPQKMSQQAVDSISQIGGGKSPFVGMAGIMTSFFKEFSYEKIGIHASLENDVFRINGTVSERGTEYYVKGSGIPVINIVNVNPDNQIRFKDMVKRIKRVTASKSSPVVK